MKIIYKCNSKIINEYEKNPFGEYLPDVGDVIVLGELLPDNTKSNEKTYEILKRNFSAFKGGNRLYSQQTCIIELKEVK